MKIVRFTELAQKPFDIHHIVTMRQDWRAEESWKTDRGGRSKNGLFFTECVIEYRNPDGTESETAPPNSVIYVPKASEYLCQFHATEDNKPYQTDYMISFCLLDEDGEEFVLSEERLILRPENVHFYREMFLRILSLDRSGVSQNARIKGILYELLCQLSAELRKSDIMRANGATVFPAVEYLQTCDIATLNSSSGYLASLCHISESYFRRLFHAYTGMSPLEYIHALRISRAETMLSSGMFTVSEVADAVGFTDASYFSRFYHMKTGRNAKSDIPKIKTSTRN